METPKPPDEQGPEPTSSSDPLAPDGPQAPPGAMPSRPGGPQAPAPPPPAPQGPWQPPGPPAGPYAPPGPEGPPSYGGPVPPGGWQQPIPQPQPGWYGRQQLASWGSRVAATLIDWLILLVPVVLLTVIVVAIAAGSDTGAIVTGGLGVLAYLIVALMYAPLLMARKGEHNGQTWGKQALGITVVRDNGDPVGFGFAALREIVVKGLLVGIASSIIPFIPWFLDNFWPLWDDQNRALHDMVCSTHVVQV
jgi:uncharacterized RDD family membrane protein YckC